MPNGCQTRGQKSQSNQDQILTPWTWKIFVCLFVLIYESPANVESGNF